MFKFIVGYGLGVITSGRIRKAVSDQFKNEDSILTRNASRVACSVISQLEKLGVDVYIKTQENNK